jgi:hypothetical protein
LVFQGITSGQETYVYRYLKKTVEGKRQSWSCARHEVMWGNGGNAPLILNVCTKWVEWSVSCPYRFYSCKKSPLYQMNRRLGGPQSRSGCFGEGHSFFFLPGIEPRYLGVPACNLFSIPIWLCIRKIGFFEFTFNHRVSWGGFSWFYSFAPSKCRNSRSIMRRLLLSKLLLTFHSSIILPYDAASCSMTAL